MRVSVGDPGRAVTALEPGGTVEVAGVQYPARCVRKLVAVGAEIVVLGQDDTGIVTCISAELVNSQSLLASDSAARSQVTGPVENNPRAKADNWNLRIHAAFILGLAIIPPAIGGYAHGWEGVGMGILLDIVFVGFWVFNGVGLNIS
jgi:hypothetical protein